MYLYVVIYRINLNLSLSEYVEDRYVCVTVEVQINKCAHLPFTNICIIESFLLPKFTLRGEIDT